MTMATTATIKEQLHLIIERMSAEQLMQVWQVLEPLAIKNQPGSTNDTLQDVTPTENSLLADPALQNIINHLTASPNWDEFLEVLDEIHKEQVPELAIEDWST